MGSNVSVSTDAPILIIQQLLAEIASELDLHYEQEDFWALGPTIDRLKPAIDYLKAHHADIPEGVTHVIERYRQSRH